MIQVYASAGVAAAFNELVEAALSAAAGLILVQESEFVFIEYPEELVPFYWLEFVFGLTKVDPRMPSLLRVRTTAGWPSRSSAHLRISS